ncbi:MAG TPA: transposase, partial [Candidatus Saccharimonadia bacterium]|nr:transposase [Candidatus Saccharimonadia bacterium]
MVGAARLHPDVRAVMPLRPAPLGKHDGTDQNAGERHAAKRVIVQLRQDHSPLTCIVTADSLRAHAPHIETRPHHALHSLRGVKEGDPPCLFQQVQVAAHAGRVTAYERHDRAAGVLHRCRCG